MVSRVPMPSLAGRPTRRRATAAVMLLAAVAALAGCGSALKASSAPTFATLAPTSAGAAVGLPATVLETLSKVLGRVYREGLHGEKVGSAESLVTHSRALREAVESGNKAAARAAAKTLLATGHLTDLLVTRGTQTLVDVGGPALTPLRGTLTGANGATIASYVTSVWADNGFLIEARGISQVLSRYAPAPRTHRRPPALGSGALASEGVLSANTSLPLHLVPRRSVSVGRLRVYLFAVRSTAALRAHQPGHDRQHAPPRRGADLLGELGQAAQKQVRRMQRNKALLEAVAHREPAATKSRSHAAARARRAPSRPRRRRAAAVGRRRAIRAGPDQRPAASERAHDRQLRALDPGRRRLPAAHHRLAGLDVLMYMNVAGSPRSWSRTASGRRRAGARERPRQRPLHSTKGTASASSPSTPRRSRRGR